jgi:hypothetical protein
MPLISTRRLVANSARQFVMGRPITGRYIARSVKGTFWARLFFSLLGRR